MSILRQQILISLAAIVLALILIWTWKARDEPVGDNQGESIQELQIKPVQNRSAGAITAGVIPAGVQRPSAPLPSVDLPLSETISNLKRLVEIGEPAAACRLAAEYAHCDTLRFRQAETSRWLSDSQRALPLIADEGARSRALSNFERDMKFREDRDDQLQSHCRDVAIPSPITNIANWRKAALMGSKAAARHYASGNAFRWNSFMEALPQLATYKLEAEQMARQLAQSGDVEITLALASGYDPSPKEERTLLAQTLKPDAAMSLALYRRVARKLEGGDSADLVPMRRMISARVDELEATIGENETKRAATIASGQLTQWAELEVEQAPNGLIPGYTRDVSLDSCSM